MATDCCKNISHRKIKIEEKGKSVTFLNPEGELYVVCDVDGCLITEGPRADKLVSKIGTASVIVELKGTDVGHACKQLLASMKSQKLTAALEKNVGFLVVCQRYPRFDAFVAKAKQQSAKLYKAGFHVVSSPKELQLERVAAINGPY